MILRVHRTQKVIILVVLSLILISITAFMLQVQYKSVVSPRSGLGSKLEALQRVQIQRKDEDLRKLELKEDVSPDDSSVSKKQDGLEVYYKSVPKMDNVPLEYEREKATFFSLVRNSDLYGILHSIRQVEDRFNKKYHYDWVFANDRPFSVSFQKSVSNLCSGNVKFVELTADYWSYPDWIDQERSAEVREQMTLKQIKYGGSESYRHMCRFNGGLFYKLPLLLDYKYYWRVEPDIEYHCDIDYDPFKYMRENNKIYGFTLAPLELHTTVPSLWDTIMNYTQEYPENVSRDNNMSFLTDDDGKSFNMCHFWSNFEIGDLDFFRSERYNHFFEYLDRAGGIYYERWGDAPIHTFAVSLLIPKDQLYFVPNTGYFHSPNGDCPRSLDLRLEKNCDCNPRNDNTWSTKSCIPKFFDIHGYERPKGASTRKYKPIHDWEQVKNDELRKEQHRINQDLKKQNDESRQEQLLKLALGVDSENLDPQDQKTSYE